MLGTFAIAQTNSTTYYYPAKASTTTPLSSLSRTPTTEEVKRATNWIIGNMEVSNELYYTIQAESNFIYFAYNPGGNSKGVAQFIPSTFKQYCRGDYNSTKDQLICMASMFKLGLQYHWDAWCNLYGHGEKHCKLRGF